MASAKNIIKEMLAAVDVEINGSRKWDIQVHDERLYQRILGGGSRGLGEAYMDGWWDVEVLDEFFFRVLRSQLEDQIRPNLSVLLEYLRSRFLNQQRTRAFEVGEEHYDIGNDLYTAMLDERMTYTCGYWKDATTLDEAQEAKLDLICKKLALKEGDRVLDIGSGWGSFINYASERYGVEGFGVTVSKEQADFANAHAKDLKVETRLQDYREVTGEFDHVVSVGMFEHVGHKNYRTFMEKTHELLKDDGLCMLHTIGRNTTSITPDPWIEKYIFPNSMLPSLKQISEAAEGLFVIEDVHNFGAYYDLTLMAWWRNFESNWDSLKGQYSDRFYRMWRYYLLSCAGSFRARKIQLWQIVLSKKGVIGGYTSLR